jgi:hypothetical protein
MGCQINKQHVKGHQDKISQHLNDEALLNITADKLATEALTKQKNR